MTARQCRLCRGDLPPRRRAYCSNECYVLDNRGSGHKTRTRSSDGEMHFVGIDGEGVTDPDGTHRYVLLSIGDRSITATESGGMLWGDHLQWWQVFRFVHDYQVEVPHATLVGFFLGYDFAQWFRTMPQERAEMLLTTKGIATRRHKQTSGAWPTTPFPVRMRDPDGVEWEFDWLPGRRLKLRPEGHKVWAYVMDCGSFWQCSLLKAIDPAGWPHPVCTPEEYAIITEGKMRRSTAVLDKDMIRYNVLENDILARIMSSLNEGLATVGIKLKKTQWFGPGQASQNWLSGQGVIDAERLGEVVPDWAYDAVAASFYGGWFDRMIHGIVKILFEYDINSAYAFAASRLPCLEHGTWTRGRGSKVPEGLALVYVKARSHNLHIGAGLPYRDAHGRISTPLATEGWYWHHEVLAAQAATDSKVDILKWVHYDPCSCRPPMHDIDRLYRHRQRVGKNSPEGRAIKLLLNSIYGKLAQSVGDPKFCNPIYASLITSACRTMILNAIATHPDRTNAVAMVATDGVYFLTEHPTLRVDPSELGLWDMTVKHNTCLFMPGMYWDDKAREALRTGGSVGFKARGINAAFLAPHIEAIDAQFRAFGEDGWTWPTAEIPVPFAMVTPKQALARGKWHLAGTIGTEGTRTLDSCPSPKRQDLPWSEDGLIRTAVPVATGEPSHPYDRFGAFGDPDEPVDPMGQGPLSVIAEWMHGE